jgi:hypothetical protein
LIDIKWQVGSLGLAEIRAIATTIKAAPIRAGPSSIVLFVPFCPYSFEEITVFFFLVLSTQFRNGVTVEERNLGVGRMFWGFLGWIGWGWMVQ